MEEDTLVDTYHQLRIPLGVDRLAYNSRQYQGHMEVDNQERTVVEVHSMAHDHHHHHHVHWDCASRGD